ncbi:hypothetical protein B9Z55_004240 [Caenorhabditis nigoni]|uniref:Uncharacterized protein n=1 Tax=Caenorhabditis nigoni TaxID=1611254 RepID=A0A2G5UVK2_9PELO|nr:hypothetical protein B9Z55_004240 [Caenorhabditis nigoni]
MEVPYQGIREILRFFWHPDIWGYIMGIWIWKYHIKASEKSCDSSGIRIYGIYHGHLDMEVPYQGIREILRFFWHPDIWDISWASGYGSTISRHQRNLAILLASGYMGIYHGHLDMEVPYQGIREILRFFWHPGIWGYIMGIWIWKYHIKASEKSCDSSGIRVYGDISWASGYGSTISRHQRNLAILLASGYMGIYHGHLDMEVPYQGIREILRFFWHPDIWGYIMGIWIWKYHIKASENLAILLASGYMGIYHGHLDMEVPYQGIRKSCDSSGIRIYRDISWASGYGSTISRHQKILRFIWHPDIWDISWASGYGSTISRHQKILRFFWHPDI